MKRLFAIVLLVCLTVATATILPNVAQAVPTVAMAGIATYPKVLSMEPFALEDTNQNLLQTQEKATEMLDYAQSTAELGGGEMAGIASVHILAGLIQLNAELVTGEKVVISGDQYTEYLTLKQAAAENPPS